ncbi:30291_t:CDS:2, partial [Racocetra persica]
RKVVTDYQTKQLEKDIEILVSAKKKSPEERQQTEDAARENAKKEEERLKKEAEEKERKKREEEQENKRRAEEQARQQELNQKRDSFIAEITTALNQEPPLTNDELSPNRYPSPPERQKKDLKKQETESTYQKNQEEINNLKKERATEDSKRYAEEVKQDIEQKLKDSGIKEENLTEEKTENNVKQNIYQEEAAKKIINFATLVEQVLKAKDKSRIETLKKELLLFLNLFSAEKLKRF